ncbi:hypothetical protein F511_02974 [Dorcoceras hygrometricum]|uniref:Uncharacterized protein n=1 Tax=Dorcoceras hygrometricum TaxID=472368 RepID=A0A2Z7CL47_9LAMI|nr:hypothetical protein F511_02974 [Dorcoceras hygrometricum]
MSLFDLQDVCIVIGSLATLDLPMVVDLIGIYVLKGPYCTLTMTDWLLQALSVIPRGSWGDDASHFTMIRWASPKLRFRSHNGCEPTATCIPEPLRVTQILGTKKTISSSYICPAVGSQYKQSAVGLVFIEWAAGLAMETSKVESAVRNQAEAKLNQLEHNKPAGTICYLEIAIAKRCRLHKLIRQRFALALKIQQEDFALITSRKIQSRATVDPDASNNSIQSRAYMNQLLLYIQSQALHIQSTCWIVLCRCEVADLEYEALGYKLNELRYELIIRCLGRFEPSQLQLSSW